MSYYLKMKALLDKPKNAMRQIARLLLFIPVLYSQFLLLPGFLLENLSPKLQRLINQGWEEFYSLIDDIISYLRETDTYKEIM